MYYYAILLNNIENIQSHTNKILVFVFIENIQIDEVAPSSN